MYVIYSRAPDRHVVLEHMQEYIIMYEYYNIMNLESPQKKNRSCVIRDNRDEPAAVLIRMHVMRLQ